MLHVSEILAIRFQKVIETLRYEHPDLLNSQILGVLEMIKFNLMINVYNDPEDDDEDEDGEQYETSETH